MNGIYAIKPLFQRSLKPFEHLAVKTHIHPDLITVSALALSIIGGISFSYTSNLNLLWILLSTPIIALTRLSLNALDGMVAIKTGKARPWGEVLNELCDRLSDIALFGGLALAKIGNSPLAVSSLFAILISSYIGILSKAVGAGRNYGGILGKADRMVLLAFFGPSAYFVSKHSTKNLELIFDLFFVLILIGSLLTILQRVSKIYVYLKHTK